MTEDCEQQAKPHAQWVYPVLHFNGKCEEALQLYKTSLGAEITGVWKGEAKQWVHHSSLKMPKSDVRIMCCDDFLVMRGEAKPMPTTVYVYVDDVDAVSKTATEAGFKAIKSVYCPAAEPTTMFWGDRTVALEDPFGHVWVLSSPAKGEASEVAEQEKTWESNYP